MTLYAIYSETEMKTVETDGWLCEAILKSGIVEPIAAEFLTPGCNVWAKVIPGAVSRAKYAAWKQIANEGKAA
jgi:hypothetical protein